MLSWTGLLINSSARRCFFSFCPPFLFLFFLGGEGGMVGDRVIGSLCACPGGSVQRLLAFKEILEFYKDF